MNADDPAPTPLPFAAEGPLPAGVPADVAMRSFVDQMGLLFEESGAPRLMGRIFGHLLVCEPETQSLPALCTALHTSKGPASIMTRQLLAAQLIERVHVRGERAAYFRVRSGAWFDLMRGKVAAITEMRRVAERGLEQIRRVDPAGGARLEAFTAFYVYIEREFALLIERYLSLRPGGFAPSGPPPGASPLDPVAAGTSGLGQSGGAPGTNPKEKP